MKKIMLITLLLLKANCMIPIYDLISPLATIDFKRSPILLRADLNIPLENGKISDDFRIKQLLPTIDLILKNNGKIVLATHIGRPKGYDKALSTKILSTWFRDHGYSCSDPVELTLTPKINFDDNDIIMLENLRFYPGEKKQDPAFAQLLANCADYYVNDAFGTIHRNDTSVAVVPYLFPENKRMIGLLVEQELMALNKLIDNPAKPFVVIIGGGKVADKLPLIEHLVGRATTILLCPSLCFPFMQALGKETGAYPHNSELTARCLTVLDKAQQKGTTLVMPEDFLVAEDNFNGELQTEEVITLKQHDFGVSIGQKTITAFAPYIKNAKTLLLNGAFGNFSQPQSLVPLKNIIELMGHSQGFSVIGGGESVAAADMFDLGASMSHLSTGGGATLTYLSGQKLPGLEPFLKNRTET